MVKKYFFYWFLVIIALAIFLRFYQLRVTPKGLYWDEVAILADAKKVLQTGSDLHGSPAWRLIYPSYGDYKLAPYIWHVIASAKLWGINSWTLRLPSAVAGILTIIFAGQLAFLLSNKQSAHLTQLATMLVLTISPWSILFSRTGFEGHLAQMYLVAGVYIIVRVNCKKQTPLSSLAWLCLASFLTGMASWTYFSVRFVYPIILVSLTIYFSYQNKNWRWLCWKNLLMGLSIFVLMMLVMTKADFYHEYTQLRLNTPSILNDTTMQAKINEQRAHAGNSRIARLFFNQYNYRLIYLLKNISSHLNPDYLFIHGDNNLRHSTGEHGLFLLIFSPFLLVGIIALSKKNFPLLLLLTVWWLAALIPASVPLTGVPHALRSINALVPVSLLIAHGLVSFWQGNNNSLLSLSTKLCLGVIMALSIGHFHWYYHSVYHQLSHDAWQADQWYLGKLLVKRSQQYERLYTHDTGNVFFLWYFVQPEVSLINLGKSENFIFTQYQNVYFDQWPPSLNEARGAYLLGQTQELQQYLATKQWDYQIIDKYQDGGSDYLGVFIN